MADEEVVLAEIVEETPRQASNMADEEVILAEIVEETSGVARPRRLGTQAWIAAAAAAVILTVSVGLFANETSWIARAILLAALAATAVWGLVLALRRGKTWTAMAGAAVCLGLCATAAGLIAASRAAAGSGPTTGRQDARPEVHSLPPPDLHPQPLRSETLAIAPQDVDISLVERIARCDGVSLTTLSLDVEQLAEGYPGRKTATGYTFCERTESCWRCNSPSGKCGGNSPCRATSRTWCSARRGW